MTQPTLYKGTFVVDSQRPEESLQKYLERVFFEFEEHMTERVPVMSQGHYQDVGVEAAGSTEIKIKAQHRITNVTIQPQTGGGAYQHDFKLTEEREKDNKDGDKVIIYIAAPTSTNPTIRILDQDDVVIAIVTFTGSGNDSQQITAIKLNDLWQV